MTRIISAIPFLLAGLAAAGPAAAESETAPSATAAEHASPGAAESDVKLKDNPPSRYTVKRGDTLWGISGRFLKNPWKWPDIWGMNREEIKNPHWIYPGDVVVLDLSGASPRLRLEGASDGGSSRWKGGALQTVKLEPRVRSEPISAAIPTIPAKEIEPFLTRPLVVDAAAIARAPKIVGTVDKRVVLAANDKAYATGLDEKKGDYWNLYRPGRVFEDPDTKETLGYEADYLGDAEVESFGEISTIHIVRADQEIGAGDRLTVLPPVQYTAYVPRAPDQKVRGKVIAGSSTAVAEIAPYSIVILNRGARDGLETGHVLGLFRSEGKVAIGDRMVPLPEQGYGMVLVFRVFDKMSYGMVMTASHPVHIEDVVKNP